MKDLKKIISIGEVLWDCFDNEKVIGGAPFNVYHYLKNSGINAGFISRVGNDNDGNEILGKMQLLELDTENIQIDKKFPTGRVNVTKLESNQPDYDIVENVAWDNIELPETDEPFYLVFGSLAQRSYVSRKTIRTLWEKAELRFYDPNLRRNYTSKEIVLDSLEVAEIVKMNDEELSIIYSWIFDEKNLTIDYKASKLIEKYQFEALAITLGEKGGIIITKDSHIFRTDGIKVKVTDTVGCGDAFFGALISGYLNKMGWQEILEIANTLASSVATKKGAVLDAF